MCLPFCCERRLNSACRPTWGFYLLPSTRRKCPAVVVLVVVVLVVVLGAELGASWW